MGRWCSPELASGQVSPFWGTFFLFGQIPPSPQFGAHPSLLGQFPSTTILGQILPFEHIPPFWAHHSFLGHIPPFWGRFPLLSQFGIHLPQIWGTSLPFGDRLPPPLHFGADLPFWAHPSILGTSPHFGHTPPFWGTPLQVPRASGDSRDVSPQGHQGRVGAVPEATPRAGDTAGAGGGLTVTTSHLGAVGDPAGDAGAGDRR